MFVYTLEQRWEILQHYFENQLNIKWVFGSLSGPAIDLQKMPILASSFSDEAYFYIGGYGNKQNCRIWGTENPHEYIEKPPPISSKISKEKPL